MKKLSILITISAALLISNLHTGQEPKRHKLRKYKKNKTPSLKKTNLLKSYERTYDKDTTFDSLHEQAIRDAQKIIDVIHNKYKKDIETKELKKQVIAYYKAILPAIKKALNELQNKKELAIKQYAASINGNPEAVKETSFTAKDLAVVYFKDRLSYAESKLKSNIKFFEESLFYLENDQTNQYLNGKTLRLISFD